MKNKVDDDVDGLFKLPLPEFIGGRKELAARLKKAGRINEAERVKLLAKPSISAWTVNQLYWNHRESFDELIATGQRFRKAQTSGKVANMREALDARRDALSHLSDLATTLLSEAGHNPSMETSRRITTTLEAVSAYTELPDGSLPGRLTKDIDPPGFESLAGFVSSAGTPRRTVEPARTGSSQKSQNTTSAAKVSRLEETRQTRIAAAKVSLQNARKSLTDARVRAQSLETAQKKADAAAKEAAKHKREAEERFKKASAAAEAAAEQAQSVRDEVEEATRAMEDAKRTVEKATRELETLFRAG